MSRMKINNTINTGTYKLSSGISISYIQDLKAKVVYLLKKEISEIWNIIVSTQDYNKVSIYAKEHNLTAELENFLGELNDKNIIEYSNSNIQNTSKYLNNYISMHDKNYKYFMKIKDCMLLNNGFYKIIYLELNYKCNLNCKHCCNPKNKNQFEIKFEDAKKIIDEAYQLGISMVILTGGECTLNKDFLKIAKYVKQKHLSLYIKTNGQMLYDDENLLKEVVDLYPSQIDISIYSLNPQIHDYITGVKGSLYKSLEVIKKLKEKEINVSIVSEILSYNKNEIDSIEEYAKNLKIKFHSDHGFIYNKKNNNLNSQLDKEVIENIYIGKLHLEEPRKKFEKNNLLICPAGTDSLSIAPNLDILPCLYFNYPLGNFNKISLKEIKEKVVPLFQKKFIRANLKECFKYDYCEYCIYCPAYSIYDRGFMKRSDALCQDAKAYQKAVMQKNNI